MLQTTMVFSASQRKAFYHTSHAMVFLLALAIQYTLFKLG